MDCSMPDFPVYHFLKFVHIHVHLVNDAIIQKSYTLSSPSPPAFNLFQHPGLFQWVGSSLRWPKYWSFSWSISPSDEYLGSISFRLDWLDLPAVQALSRVSSNITVQKNMLAMLETWVRSLGWEDPLEKEMAPPTQYSCLENSRNKEAWQATVHRVPKSWHDWATNTFSVCISEWSEVASGVYVHPQFLTYPSPPPTFPQW